VRRDRVAIEHLGRDPRKVLEYLEAGTRLVWVVHPEARTVTEYRSPTEFRILAVTDELDGGGVLPDFRTPVASIFPR
jgi:Uma2 family endonuclease